MDDDVCSVVDGADEVATGSEGVVNLCVSVLVQSISKVGTHNERNAMIMGNLGNGLEVWDVVLWISNALNVHGLCLVVNCRGEVLRLVSVDKLGGYAQSREEDLQLVVGSAVEVAGGHDVVSGVREGCNGHELSCLAGRGSHRRNSALQSCDSLLEDIDGRLWTRGSAEVINE